MRMNAFPIPLLSQTGAPEAAATAAASRPFGLFHLVLSLGILAGCVLLGLALQRFVARRIRAWAAKTATEWDDILVASLRGLFVLWFLLAGLALVLKLVPLPPEVLTIVRRAVGVLGILSAVIFFTRLVRAAIYVYIDRKIELPSSIFKNFATFVIYVLGFLFILDYLGISITPLLTALGVGGLAVALAFQDTLANLFAGMNILMARKIQRGDYVRLESGEEGEVCDITWRNTTLMAPENNMVVVPNSKLAAAIYTNVHLPQKEMGLFVPVTVSYDNDLDQVERVTLEVAREVMAVPDLAVPGFEPKVRVGAFSELGARLTVVLRVKEFQDQFPLRHEFLKRLHARYRAEGITLAALPPGAVRVEKP
jgi:small-conductance mechanosensitive channel